MDAPPANLSGRSAEIAGKLARFTCPAQGLPCPRRGRGVWRHNEGPSYRGLTSNGCFDNT